MLKLNTSAAPHIHSGASSNRIMLDVIIALLPATLAGIVIFGWQGSLPVLISCVLTAVIGEAVFNIICKKKQTVGDLTAVITGLLLALNLSTNVPVWQCVVGTLFAIICVKCLFGGLGHNFANPAITGRVFMLVAFEAVAGGANPTVVELVSSATPLEQLAKNETLDLMDLFLGLHGGAIGETCILALLIGFVYLLVRKVISWHTPVVFIATVFVLYLAFAGNFDIALSQILAGNVEMALNTLKDDLSMALSQILAGGLFIGAIFMATDYVTTPMNTRGRVVFAVGCGVITFIIRYFCSYPEGVSFSILIMNLLTPFVEKLTAKIPLGGEK